MSPNKKAMERYAQTSVSFASERRVALLVALAE
jgi:hypothetical protein